MRISEMNLALWFRMKTEIWSCSLVRLLIPSAGWNRVKHFIQTLSVFLWSVRGVFFFILSTLCSNNEAISDCGQHDDVWRPNAMRGNVAATEPGVERWTNQNTDHENINWKWHCSGAHTGSEAPRCRFIAVLHEPDERFIRALLRREICFKGNFCYSGARSKVDICSYLGTGSHPGARNTSWVPNGLVF